MSVCPASGGKVRHETQAAAMGHRARLRRDRGAKSVRRKAGEKLRPEGRFSTYFCLHCQGWHVGHVMGRAS